MFTRSCPVCLCELVHPTKYARDRYVRLSILCHSCAQKNRYKKDHEQLVRKCRVCCETKDISCFPVIAGTIGRRKMCRDCHRSSHNVRYAAYKGDAKRYKRCFELTFDEFVSLVTTSCHYCGADGWGIDRKDSSVGYILQNCLPCCSACNCMKMHVSYDEFIERCRLISSRFN